MNLLEALNNENSDELQKRIRLLDVSARNCPKRKADRVEYLQEQSGYWSQRYGQSKPKRVNSLLGLVFYG